MSELLSSEWLALLRYYTACGEEVPGAFAAQAALWLKEHMGRLQLDELQELLVSLAVAGQGGVLELLPGRLRHLGAAEPREATLTRLAALLAAQDVGDRTFYRHVLDTIGSPSTLGESDEWRLSLLFFLTKAEVVRWPLVLNILRNLEPSVASSTPRRLDLGSISTERGCSSCFSS